MNDLTPVLEYDPNSAMAALQPQRRLFVERMREGGASQEYVERAAAAAGYSRGHGWKLMREPRVLAALREEAAKGLLGGALIAQKVLIEIATDTHHKDRLKAARELLAHSGFTTVIEQKITVEHVNAEARELVQQIADFAKATGLDAKQLLGSLGIREPVDAEFEEVKPEEEVWSA
jgi:hypothetical protein